MDSLLAENVLRKLHSLFRSCLNFQSILPGLRLHNLLTDYEWQVIKNKDTHDDQVDEFLQYLPHKGRNCLDKLIDSLELSLDHAGHNDLLVELKKEVNIYNGDTNGRHEVCICSVYVLYKVCCSAITVYLRLGKLRSGASSFGILCICICVS